MPALWSSAGSQTTRGFRSTSTASFPSLSPEPFVEGVCAKSLFPAIAPRFRTIHLTSPRGGCGRRRTRWISFTCVPWFFTKRWAMAPGGPCISLCLLALGERQQWYVCPATVAIDCASSTFIGSRWSRQDHVVRAHWLSFRFLVAMSTTVTRFYNHDFALVLCAVHFSNRPPRLKLPMGIAFILLVYPLVIVGRWLAVACHPIYYIVCVFMFLVVVGRFTVSTMIQMQLLPCLVYPACPAPFVRWMPWKEFATSTCGCCRNQGW